jgi:hypothetical protein
MPFETSPHRLPRPNRAKPHHADVPTPTRLDHAYLTSRARSGPTEPAQPDISGHDMPGQT